MANRTKGDDQKRRPKIFTLHPSVIDALREESEDTNVAESRIVELALEKYFADAGER